MNPVFRCSVFRWLLYSVMRTFCLVESRSQDAAANVGVLSVYLTTILLFDIERENIPCFHSLYIPCVHLPCLIVRATCYDQPVLIVGSEIWKHLKSGL